MRSRWRGRANAVLLCALAVLAPSPSAAQIVGSLIPRMTTIYRAPPQGASAAPPATPGVGEASLLEDLALRVNLDDQLRSVDKAGTRASGRLIGLTAGELTLRTAAGEQRFPRASLREVAVRRRPLRAGVLIGAGAGAALGALAACTADDREECPDAALIAGGLGAGVGLGLAALMPRATVVYPEAGSRMSVLPVLMRTGGGVRVSRRVVSPPGAPHVSSPCERFPHDRVDPGHARSTCEQEPKIGRPTNRRHRHALHGDDQGDEGIRGGRDAQRAVAGRDGQVQRRAGESRRAARW